jgi:hypothetical protein
MSRSRAVLLSVPLVVLGTLFAHALTYRLAYPDAAERALADEAVGHGYLGELRLVTTACVALIVVAVAMIALEARRDVRRTVPPWLFASLPLVGFTAQEVLERVTAGSGFGAEELLGPTFVLGLLVQLPVAALMYAVARVLSRLAVEFSEALARAGVELRVHPTDGSRAPWPTLWLEPRLATLELRRGGRAPPFRLDRR